MSSIDRAMSRLSGEPEDPPGVEPRAAEANAAPAAEATEMESASTAGAANVVGAMPLVEPGPAVNAPPSAVVPAAVPSAPPSTARSEPEPQRIPKHFVQLDLARMSAAGFLTPDQPMSRQSEEFQHIKRRLLGNMVPGMLPEGRPTNLILITSSVPGEGKTFTSTNLTMSIAMEVDHTVLAVDTDIMKRDLSKVFGVVDRPGLFDLLGDPRLRLEDLLVRTSIPNLVLLPAGNRREGSTELLASIRMRELTDEIAIRYHDRVVLFDSPPVLATTTATALAPFVGQIILVAEAGNTKHETIREALQRLDRVRLTGVILNKSKQSATPSYDYYGSYYQTRN